MTIAELSQVKYKKREIDMIPGRIDELYDRLEHVSKTASDSVQSAAEFPFAKSTVIISGTDMSAYDKIIKRIGRLRERQLRLCEDVNEAEEFIDGLDDSQLRQILELKFIKGHSWNMAAQWVYEYPDGDRARKKVERFFKNL